MQISSSQFYFAYNEYSKSLRNLKNRFSRNELHISFVGQAGQGKSKIMQKISGLQGEIIPSSDGSDCTGAKSVITNDPSANEVYAQVEFFKENEIVDIVNTYISTVFNGSVSSVGNLDEIARLPISELEGKLPSNSTDLQMKFEHLGEFRDKLGQKITVQKNEIESYVAQYKNSAPATKYYKYLGVKEANIKCKFNYEDAGKIVLVDTIGLGATSIGVQQEMEETIENDRICAANAFFRN